MLQDVIVYFIILFVIFYTFYHIFIIFTARKKNTCGDCPSCELKKEVLQKNGIINLTKHLDAY